MDDVKFAPERPAADVSPGLQQFTRMFVGDEQMLALWAGLSGEFGRFMTARLMRNLDTMRTMAQCRGSAEFMELQLKWARDAWDDYMAEANRLMGCGASRGGSTLGGPSETAVAKPAAKTGAPPPP